VARAEEQSTRGAGIIVACAGAVASGLLVIGFAGASVASGHGSFSGAIAGWLAVYGLVCIAAAWALWRGLILGRGPVLTLSALNLIVAFTMTQTAPLAWLVVVVSAITLVAVSLPSTARGLRWSPVKPAGGPPPTDARES
jgi:hypothetical protein